MDGRETLWKRAPLVIVTDGQTSFRGDLSTTNGHHAPGDGACDGNPRRIVDFRSPRPFSDTWLSSTGPSARRRGGGWLHRGVSSRGTPGLLRFVDRVGT